MNRVPMDSMDGADRHRPEAVASVPELLKRLSGEGSELVRQEIALAKAEMEEKLETVKRSAATLGAGAGLMLAGLLFALWSLNTGVTAALMQVMDAEIAVWLAPLLLAAVLLAVGWALISSARSTLADETVMPEGSRESLRNDRRWAENKVEQVKGEVRG